MPTTVFPVWTLRLLPASGTKIAVAENIFQGTCSSFCKGPRAKRKQKKPPPPSPYVWPRGTGEYFEAPRGRNFIPPPPLCPTTPPPLEGYFRARHKACAPESPNEPIMRLEKDTICSVGGISPRLAGSRGLMPSEGDHVKIHQAKSGVPNFG